MVLLFFLPQLGHSPQTCTRMHLRHTFSLSRTTKNTCALRYIHAHSLTLTTQKHTFTHMLTHTLVYTLHRLSTLLQETKCVNMVGHISNRKSYCLCVRTCLSVYAHILSLSLPARCLLPIHCLVPRERSGRAREVRVGRGQNTNQEYCSIPL